MRSFARLWFRLCSVLPVDAVRCVMPCGRGSYTPEQQARLGVDSHGHPVEAAAKGKVKALPPAWLSGSIEKPAGEKNHGTYTSLV
jgi:hypothetical protein